MSRTQSLFSPYPRLLGLSSSNSKVVALSLLTLACAAFSPYRKLFFLELVSRAKQREEEEAERLTRAKDKFAALLRHLRKIDADTTWEAFLSKYDQEPEYKAVSLRFLVFRYVCVR